MENKKYFKLYACCLPVKGFKNSIICDVQRGSFKHIPNALYNILLDLKALTFKEIYDQFSKEDQEVVDEYLSFLIENEFGFWTDSPERFPEIDLKYLTPSQITNAIIDSNQNSEHDFKTIFGQLEYLGCKNLQLRFFDEILEEHLYEVIHLLNSNRIKSVEIILKDSNHFNKDSYTDLLNVYGRISTIIVHSSVADQVAVKGFNGMGRLIYIRQQIDSEMHCGEITPINFSINLETFSEAIHYNSCLNRKISIDKDGYIKNCPTMFTNYGHNKEVSLIEVANHKDFQNIWSINKDQIEVCKDCEFRYICTDCRAILKTDDNIYSKPSKCSYDPYIGIWN
ncbi:MAG: grasp-with-spasm system SPASM domain peptide maturase [Cytophagales bacterium]|nr:grasp-with-spasm system SPASM domain peptide maturase [Cytophagales bacterium]MCA6373930.1 grasp-with-spasm system SPASM domain peptide maturase [Cytophagales bacterium]MCA6377853.1 grasp-with-spasm system SPASM domain peptide maturase [Cytophagales bacterium]MCA6385892.1 grasp-with-spasm system SPASM domain peptide maturase [Cytophagales bacterium]